MLMGIESTIKKFIIEYNHDPLTKDALQLKNIEILNKDKKMIIPYEDIFHRYRTDLETFVEHRELTEKEKRRWFYNPKIMSYDLYNTTELWFTIIELNEIYSGTQLNMSPIKYYSPKIIQLLSRINALEKIIIDENQAEISAGILI